MGRENKCVLIFSGFNQRATISFIRTMNQKNLKYAIIAISNTDDIFLTEYHDKVLAIREHRTLELSDLLNSIYTVQEKMDANEYIIAPTTEALNRFLLDNRGDFEEINCTIPLVEKDLYELVSNKYSFGSSCSENNIVVPKEVNINEELVLPIVAKPKKYFSSIDKKILAPVIILNSTEFKLFAEKYNTSDFYFQEYIGGKSLYLLYYFHKNGEVYKFSQENLVQQPGGKSMLAAVSSNFHNSSESNKYEKLFKDLNYFGLVMIEVKQYNNTNYMIEANPRFWGPSQLFVDAGMNLFDVFLHDIGMLGSFNFPRDTKSTEKYFWFGGLAQYLGDLNKVDFYNYKEEFYKDFWGFLNNDIYFRQDTKNIFSKELFNLTEENILKKLMTK